jgi:hypothetical protein
MAKESESARTITTVGDVSIYVGKVFKDDTTRRWFASLIESLKERLDRKAFGLARKRADEARAALRDAARLDPDGDPDGDRAAEREAILLALNAATHRIPNRTKSPPRGIEMKITLV